MAACCRSSIVALAICALHSGCGLSHDEFLKLDQQAESEVASGLVNRAIETDTKIIEFDSSYARARLRRGACYLALREYDRSLSDFDEALRLDPSNGAVSFNRGMALEPLGRIDEAEAAYRKALALGYRSRDVHNHLGMILSSRDDFTGAAEQYGLALELEPKEPVLWLNRGSMFVDLERYDEGIEDYHRVIELLPDDFVGYRMVAVAARAKGDLKTAEEFERQAEQRLENPTIMNRR